MRLEDREVIDDKSMELVDSINSMENGVEEDNNIKPSFFARLKEGLNKTRKNIVYNLDSLFGAYDELDDDFFEELEEILIMGDMGVATTDSVLERLKERIKDEAIKEPVKCREALIEELKDVMRVDDSAYQFEKQVSVIVVIGVNGVGKTTSIGKLAYYLKKSGKKVVLAAADTFRAAAGEQLKVWAIRAGVDIILSPDSNDPASVVYDGINAAKARGADVLLVDTAGRLHNKKNLMEELRKMDRIINTNMPHVHRENLVVLDATTGQNAVVQAKAFNEVMELTGIILTKMDGTAKGGVAIAIHNELDVPVKFIGVGERIDDIQKFDSNEFIEALFDSN